MHKALCHCRVGHDSCFLLFLCLPLGLWRNLIFAHKTWTNRHLKKKTSRWDNWNTFVIKCISPSLSSWHPRKQNAAHRFEWPANGTITVELPTKKWWTSTRTRIDQTWSNQGISKSVLMLNLSGFTMTRNEKWWENESDFWSHPVGSRKTGYVETRATKIPCGIVGMRGDVEGRSAMRESKRFKVPAQGVWFLLSVL